MTVPYAAAVLARIRRWLTAGATPPGPELTPEEEDIAREQTHDDYGSLGWRPGEGAEEGKAAEDE